MKKNYRYTFPFYTICIFFLLGMTIYSFAETAKTAPEVSGRDLQGQMVSLSEMLTRGPVVVYFWSACCGLDLKQLDALKKLYDNYKSHGFSILAVDEDGANKISKVKQTVKAKRMPFVVLVDKNREFMGKYKAFAVPSVYLVGTDMKISYSKTGYMAGDEKKLEAQLQKLLSASSQTSAKDDE